MAEPERLPLAWREALAFLGNHLDSPWPRERYRERWEAHGQNSQRLLLELLELHRDQHSSDWGSLSLCPCVRLMMDRYAFVRDLVLARAYRPPREPDAVPISAEEIPF